MPFVIRHGSSAQAAMAKEQGRLQAEALEAESDARMYRDVAGSFIGVANRYFARREQERQQEFEEEQKQLDRDFEATQRGLDRTSRESIASKNIEGRLAAVERQQQGQTERTNTQQAGQTERSNAENETRLTIAGINEEGRDRRATQTEQGRNARQEAELKTKAAEAARKAAVDAEIGNKAKNAVVLAYEADGRDMDDWGQLAIDYIARGKAIPKWLENRLPTAPGTAAKAETPSDTEQAWRGMALHNPMGAWAAANEKQADKDGNPTNIPTRQAAAALRGITSMIADPTITPQELSRVYTELKLRMLDDPQPSPALQEIVRMLEQRLGPGGVPSVQAPPKQGGGFWSGYGGAMDSAMTWTNPLYAGGKAIYKAATGKGKPAATGGSNLDAVLDSMSPEEIKALLSEE